jgi:hypothetical protein
MVTGGQRIRAPGDVRHLADLRGLVGAHSAAKREIPSDLAAVEKGSTFFAARGYSDNIHTHFLSRPFEMPHFLCAFRLVGLFVRLSSPFVIIGVVVPHEIACTLHGTK